MKNIFKYSLKTGATLSVIILLTIILRVFIFDTYSIPSPSMEPTIMTGDHVVVNKFIPGPRITKNFYSLRKGEKPQFTRINVSAIKRNDILVFNYPYSEWRHLGLNLGLYYAKRCVALPGDTFYIDNCIYKVKGCRDTLGYYKNQKAFSLVDTDQIAPEVLNTFPYDKAYNWNIKNWGPMYIPAKGDLVSLDSINICLYHQLIEYESNKDIKIKRGEIFLSDSLIKTYQFTKNYYFMAGDLVTDSQDSRYWGLLPEDHIVGKVSFVWNTKNIYTKEINWSRFLKKIK